MVRNVSDSKPKAPARGANGQPLPQKETPKKTSEEAPARSGKATGRKIDGHGRSTYYLDAQFMEQVRLTSYVLGPKHPVNDIIKAALEVWVEEHKETVAAAIEEDPEIKTRAAEYRLKPRPKNERDKAQAKA